MVMPAPEPWHDHALAIARAIAAEAVWSGDLCAFHGAIAPEQLGGPPRFRSLGADLYEGSAGIARFLAHAAVCGDDAALHRTARGALAHALAVPAAGWSLFSGEAGVALVALELAELLDAPDLVAPAVERLERASAAALGPDGAYDLLGGTAGTIVALTAALRYDLDGGWLARAFDLGRRLLAMAFDADRPERLCGLGHGASGAAFALERLAAHAPEEPGWSAAARRARDWERAHYAPDAGSWADLRAPEPGMPSGPIGHPHMWCHGSVGITAERLRAPMGDRLALADAAAGLAGVLAQAHALIAGPCGAGAGDAVNGSQCHGLAGMIDLLVDAAGASGDAALLDTAAAIGRFLLDDGRRPEGWRSGIPGGWATPGLMLGTSGIGWSFLRLANPVRTPPAWLPGPPIAGRAGPSSASAGR